MSENTPKHIKWQVPEYKRPERQKNWYRATGIFVLICLFFCFFAIQSWKIVFLGPSSNFLFALIIIVASIVMIINESQPPMIVKVEFGPEGLKLGAKFYHYDDFKNFTVLYKPRQSVKHLYLEFKNQIRPRLSIPLRRMDALTVRNFLIKYLAEDLERTEQPLSEQLTKLFKL